jgi:hypothetical protein
MAYNGTGTFNRAYNWVTDAGNGINIEAVRMDGEDDGFATGLSNAITKDGQTTITANIPFNSKKITGLANGSARTDSITLGQVQDGTYKTLGTLGGSADTYTASPSPAITTYTTGSEFNLKVNADNTGASTLNVSAIDPKDIKKYDGAGAKVAIGAGDLQQDQYYKVIYDGVDFILIGKNPATTTISGQSLLPDPITISNGTDADHDIDFTAGNFNFDDGSGQAVATALTKQIDATWVAGDNAGGLDTGSVQNSTFYYCYAISNITTGVSDFLFTASYGSPTFPSGYTKKTYQGAILTNGSGNIRVFYRYGNRFLFDTVITDYTPSPSSGTFTSYQVSVPRINNIIGLLSVSQTYIGSGVVSQSMFWRPTGSSSSLYQISSGAISGYAGKQVPFQPFMNNNAIVDIRFDFSSPSNGFTVKTEGWIDKNL